MAPCRYCGNLDLPSYQTVAQSRTEILAAHNGLSVVPSAKPRGLKPHIDIALDEILTGASVIRCDACIMLRDALLATFNGSLKEVTRIQCQSSSRNTLMVTASLNRGYKRLEFYTLEGMFLCSSRSALNGHSIVLFVAPRF